MSDRNTTIITDRGGGMATGIVIGAILVIGVLFMAFVWHPWTAGPARGPTVNITASPATPSAPIVITPSVPVPAAPAR